MIILCIVFSTEQKYKPTVDQMYMMFLA